MGPARTTFRSPTPPTPLTPRASVKALSSLNLVAMSPPTPYMGNEVPDSPASVTASTDLQHGRVKVCNGGTNAAVMNGRGNKHPTPHDTHN